MRRRARGRLAGLAAALLLGVAFPAAPAATAPASGVRVEYGTLSSGERVLWERQAERVQAAAAALDGLLGVAVKDVRGGATIELNAGLVLPTASVIKVAVLYELYRQAEAGQIDLAEVTRPPLPRAGGSGILQALSGEARLTWRDLAVLMIGLSDNAATNVLLERLGGPAAIDTRLRELGLRATRLRRRMMDLEAARRGDENVSSPAELVALMDVVRRGPGLSPERARDMLEVAALPKTSPFREVLPETLTVADKPGELEGVRAAAALVELPGRPYLVAIMTAYLRSDPDGDATLRALSRALYETFERLAQASEYGRRMP